MSLPRGAMGWSVIVAFPGQTNLLNFFHLNRMVCWRGSRLLIQNGLTLEMIVTKVGW